MTPSRPLSQRVMGFNWTQLSASKAHNHERDGETGQLGPRGCPFPRKGGRGGPLGVGGWEGVPYRSPGGGPLKGRRE